MLHTSALAFQVVKYLGVAYLLYMAWATWKDRGALTVDEESTPRSAVAVVGSGILISILNPKLVLFFVAFLPQFVSADVSSRLLQMLELSGVFMLLTFVVFAAYGALSAMVRTHVIARPRVVAWMPHLRGRLCRTLRPPGIHRAVTQQSTSTSASGSFPYVRRGLGY